MIRTVRIPVGGMKCVVCSNAVEEALGGTEGVEDASVNLGNDTVTVRFDPDAVDLESMESIIKDLGFQPAWTKLRFTVEGMECAACVNGLEKSLLAREGVRSATANLATSNLTVEYDEGLLDEGRIVSMVEKAGFKVASAEMEDVHAKEMEGQKRLILIAAALGIPVFILSMLFGMTSVTLGLETWMQNLLLFILTTPVQLYCGRQFYSGTLAAIRARRANMDTLIAMGTTAAYAYSTAVTFLPGLFVHSHVYFESSAMIILLILVGKYLEMFARHGTSEALRRLMDLQPRTATVLRDGKESLVSVDELEVGDLVLVRPGGQVPADGKVAEGSSSVDESMVTGESIPVPKSAGDEMIGGTINQNGTVNMTVTRLGKDTVLSQIVRMVEDAQSSKAPIQRIADTVSAYFVPIVIVLALTSFAFWYLVGFDAYGSDMGRFPLALTVFITVLVISCPCALGLATPTAIMVGTGKGAEYGILIRNGSSLERAGKVDIIAFDKTGTLTSGRPVVTDIITYGDADVLSIAAAGESRSEHPIATAVLQRHQEEFGTEPSQPESFLADPGKGLNFTLKGRNYALGSMRMMEGIPGADRASVDMRRLASSGRTPIALADDDSVLGIIAVADPIKDGAVEALNELRRMGVEAVMITGDRREAAEAIAAELGITRVLAEVLPGDKADAVKGLAAEGVVAMVGDGINDAPALVMADVGIAMGSGTDVAIETADIVLIRDDVRDVAAAMQMSRRTLTKIHQNLFFAFVYNVTCIPLAAGILYPSTGILLPPMAAAAAMALSNVSVVGNALLLKRYVPGIKRSS